MQKNLSIDIITPQKYRIIIDGDEKNLEKLKECIKNYHNAFETIADVINLIKVNNIDLVDVEINEKVFPEIGKIVLN